MTRLYVLIDPVTLEIRYVGLTTMTLRDRLSGHCSGQGKTYAQHWIKSLLQSGLKPLIAEIDVVDDDLADDAERFYIQEYRSLGCRLTNCCGGGRKNRIVSKETREKQSVVRKGKQPWLGRTHSTESREKMSEVKKGKTLSPETRMKISTFLLGNRHSVGRVVTQEQKDRISASWKGRHHSAVAKEKIAAATSGPFEVISPDGTLYSGTNFCQFCREHGLPRPDMYRVLRGERKHCKGWRFPLSHSS